MIFLSFSIRVNNNHTDTNKGLECLEWKVYGKFMVSDVINVIEIIFFLIDKNVSLQIYPHI